MSLDITLRTTHLGESELIFRSGDRYHGLVINKNINKFKLVSALHKMAEGIANDPLFKLEK